MGGTLKSRPQPAKLLTCELERPKELAPRKQQQIIATAAMIQGDKGPSKTGSQTWQ